MSTHVSAWFGRDERPPTSGVSPIGRRIARTWAGGDCARPNQGLTTVVLPEECPNSFVILMHDRFQDSPLS